MTYGALVKRANDTVLLDQSIPGGNIFVAKYHREYNDGLGTTTYTYPAISSHTYLKVYQAQAGPFTYSISTVNNQATLTITPIAELTIFSFGGYTLLVFATKVEATVPGLSFTNDSGETIASTEYPCAEYLGKIVPNSNGVWSGNTYDNGTIREYSHSWYTTIGSDRLRMVLWTLPDTSVDCYMATSDTVQPLSLLLPGQNGGSIKYFCPPNTSYSTGEGFIFALDKLVPSTDVLGLRIYDSSTPQKLLFDSGLDHMVLKAIDSSVGYNISTLGNVNSYTLNSYTGITPAVFIPAFTALVFEHPPGARITRMYEGAIRRSGNTVYTRTYNRIYITEYFLGSATSADEVYYFGKYTNLVQPVIDIAKYSGVVNLPLGGIVTRSSITDTCSYNESSATTCSTSETFTAAYTNGNNGAVTYGWSITGPLPSQFTLSAYTGNTTTITLSSSGASTGTVSNTILTCTISQVGSTNIVLDQAISHIHTGDVAPLIGSISQSAASTSCSYTSPTAACTDAETWTATTSGGNGNAISYAWSVPLPSQFSLSATTGNATTISSNMGSNVSTTLTCTISQSGSTNIVINQAISHTHTGYAAVTATTTQNAATTFCSYTLPNTYCTTQETWTAAAAGGTGAVTYSWSIEADSSYPTQYSNFSLSSYTDATTIISSNASGASNGTIYHARLRCQINKSGTTIVVDKYIAHTHTGGPALSGSISQSAASTSCSYTAPTAACTDAETWTATTSGGNGNAISYAWSVPLPSQFSLSATTGNATTISSSTGNNLSTILTCTISQSGSTDVVINQNISHTHIGYTALTGYLSRSAATISCSYTSPTTTCTDTETWTAIASGGNGNPISYAWYMPMPSQFSLSATTGNTTTVSSNTGGNVSDWLTCTISQSGAADVVLSQNISHTHTGYPALAATTAQSNSTTTCSYTDPGSCSTQETWTASTSGGNGSAISYAWSTVGGNAASFGLSSTSASATTISLSATGLSTGTTYSTTLRCVVSQSGASSVTVDKAISHTHTGTPALSANATASSSSNTCNYTNPTTSCSTQETWTISTSGGNGSAISYAWSTVGGNAASFGLSSTSASATTISLSATGLSTGTTYSTTLRCVVSQSGASSVTVDKAISHTHIGYPALTGYLSRSAATISCSYTSPTTTCTDTETWTAIASGGNGNPISYAWYMPMPSQFSLSATTGNTTTVSSNTGGNVSDSLTCTISQSGAADVVLSQNISHTHTGYAALANSISRSNPSTSCSYINPTTSCSTQETWTAAPTGGNGSTITYYWYVSGGNYTYFNVSSSSAASTTISVSAAGVPSGTTYSTNLYCEVSQAGAATVYVSTPISHTHTGYFALTGTTTQSDATTSCSYTAPTAYCTDIETWSANVSGGNGNAISYLWSLPGTDPTYFNLNATTNSYVIVYSNKIGLSTGTTYTGTIRCTISQSGSSDVVIDKGLSHIHIGYPALAGSISQSAATTSCSYTSPTTTCTDTETWTVTTSGGNSNAISYVWSIPLPSQFSLSATTGNTTTISSNMGSNVSTTLTCTISQPGAADVTLYQSISHTHTAATVPLSGTISLTTETASCSYYVNMANSCNTSTSLSITPTGGDGTAITYNWFTTSPGYMIYGETSMSYGIFRGTGTVSNYPEYASITISGSLKCTMTQSGVSVTKSYLQQTEYIALAPVATVQNPMSYQNATFPGVNNGATTLTLYSDGTANILTSDGQNFPSSWATPTTAGLGSSYYVRFTRTYISQSATGNSVAASTDWLSLASGASVSVQHTGVTYGYAIGTYTVEISNGQWLVSSTAGISLEVNTL